jgi:very-short-patch-repair endonuclease
MLAGLNIIVLRFQNEEVINNIKDVLNKIREVADLQNSDV